MKKAIIGQKIGMTQYILETGKIVPVTVIWAAPNVLVQKRTTDVDGYEAVQLGYGDMKVKRVNWPLSGHFAKAGVAPKRHLREFKLEDAASMNVGDEIKVDVFTAGEKVDVAGTSKGKGFAGVIKKGNHRGPETHGSKSHRTVGSMGSCSDPSRVFKGKTMPGHLGNSRVTVQNLEVVMVDTDNHLILVKGAVPGPNKGIVTVINSVKA